MAEFQPFDLGRVIQTAEAIKGMKRQAESDKLRDQYLGQKMQNEQADREAESTSAAQTIDARKAFGISSALAHSDSPLKDAQQYAPDLLQALRQQYGESLTDDIVRHHADFAMRQAAPSLGITLPEPKSAVRWVEKKGPRGSIIQENPETGEQKQVVGPDNSQPAGPQAFDPQSAENTAQLIAANQIPMLSGYALRTPWGQAVVSRVREINPQFAGQDYGSQLSGVKQFTSGKNGNTIRSLNVAVQHLDQLGTLASALGNGDVQLFNKLGNEFSRATGSAAPTNFDTAKKIVADEIVKAIVGSGGGVADREEAAKSISNVGSPAQLQQAIQTYQGLLTGQLNGLRQQYQTATGRTDFENFLLPETKAKLESHSSGNQQQSQDKPMSPEEASKLPPGTSFVGLDGVRRVKH